MNSQVGSPACKNGAIQEARSAVRALLLAITVFAAAVRFIGLDWDQGHGFHPDERAIAFAVERLSFAPLQLNPQFFAYGTLPLYLTRLAIALARLVHPSAAGDFSFLILTGRAISAIAGVATLLLLFTLGRRIFGWQVGALASVLLAGCVLHVQHSHFMTNDVVLTLVVLAALTALVTVVEKGRRRDYLLAGVLIGLSLATKASAAPLAVPMALALLVRAQRRDGHRRVLAGGSLMLLAAAVGFVVGQPYAILDFSTFWQHLTEQGRMARQAGLVPYTTQYIGTTKYAYELTQMVLWGMAPPLGLAAILGAGAHARRLPHDRRAADLLLVAWVLPYFLITGWLDVKFMRYLLPIYPILILWAAAWLWDCARRERWGQLLTALVVAATLLSVLAFVAIYEAPHTAVTASRWAYEHIAPGRTIAIPEWDEGFPLPLRDARPDRFRVVTLPHYAPDEPTKIRALARRLADADFLVYPTTRLYGAIARVPDRYPLTSNYFRLLFAGDLGYRLVHTEVSRPRLGPLEVPDELADESFRVYDHPKVVVFENTGRQSAERLYDDIVHRAPSRPLTHAQLLLARPEPGSDVALAAIATMTRSNWRALLGVVVAVELSALAAYALLRAWLPEPGGYAVAKILGLLILVYPPWLLTSLGIISFTRPVLRTSFILLVMAGALALSRRSRGWLPPDARPTEILFWGVCTFFLVVRAWNPAIFWGEKPMDFALLNTLTRSETFPPPDPWFAGSALHYTYFGHYIVAALGKLCAIHPGVMFNLGIALFGGLTATAAYAAGCSLADRVRTGMLAAVFVVGLGNLTGPLEFVSRRTLNFDYFWATSRVIKDTINEYPLWTFLFADLHAHALVMPLSLTFLALLVWHVRTDSRLRQAAVSLLLLGFVLGALAATNGWSVPTHVLLLTMLPSCVLTAGPTTGVIIALRRVLARAIMPAVIVVFAAVTLYLPFLGRGRPPAPGWAWERDASVHIGQLAAIFGVFLFVTIPFLFGLWRDAIAGAPSRDRKTLTLWPWFFGIVAAIAFALTLPPLPAAVKAMLARLGADRAVGEAISLHLSSVRTGLFVLSIAAFWLGARAALAPRRRLAAALIGVAFLMTAGCDVVHVWDRMNTIFKFYLDAWVLLAVASAVAWSEAWRSSWQPWSRLWRTGFVGVAAAAIFTAVSVVYAGVETQRAETVRPTLDGTRYLAHRARDENAAIEWLNRHVDGIPVLAEASGPPYTDFARISMNTGLPSVLGWDYHVLQRGQSRESITERRRALEDLYTSPQRETVTRVLDRYGVSLIYVGRLERTAYRGGNLEHFRQWSDLLVPVFHTDDVTVFRVRGTRGVDPALIAKTWTGDERVAEDRGRLRQPRGVTVDGHGTVYVADFGNHRVQLFTADLRPLRALGGPGDLPGQFREPCAVAVDDRGNVYVADTWNHRVQVFDQDGVHRGAWTASLFGPRGIATGPGRRVYVVDTGNHRVVRFSAEGEQEYAWGGPGSGPGQFKDPMGIAVDAAGQIYVADNGNGRVQVFDAGARFLRAFPVKGWRTAAFSEPSLVVTPDGRLWVTVPLAGLVRVYTRDGHPEVGIPAPAPEDGRPARPTGLAFSAAKQVIVVADLDGSLGEIPLVRPVPQSVRR